MASRTEGLYFKFCLIAIPENINSLMWPVATMLDKEVSKFDKQNREMSAGDLIQLDGVNKAIGKP